MHGFPVLPHPHSYLFHISDNAPLITTGRSDPRSRQYPPRAKISHYCRKSHISREKGNATMTRRTSSPKNVSPAIVALRPYGRGIEMLQ